MYLDISQLCKYNTVQRVLRARSKFLRNLRVSTAFANISKNLRKQVLSAQNTPIYFFISISFSVWVTQYL